MFDYLMKTMFAALLAVALISDSAPAQSSEPGCPETSDPYAYGSGALGNAAEQKNGVEYVDQNGVGVLKLIRSGGAFRSAANYLNDLTVFAAPGDFNGDGWEDFVGGDVAGYTNIYLNDSYLSLPAGDPWADTNFSLDGSFSAMIPSPIARDASGNYYMLLAAGDFNGDGRADVFRANQTVGWPSWPISAQLWLNTGVDAYGAPTFAAPYNALAGGTLPIDLGQMDWAGTNVVVTDYNGDRRLDLLVANSEGFGGAIRIFLNTCTPVAAPPAAPALVPCTDNPTFSLYGPLIEDMGLDIGVGGLPVFAYDDFDGDGLRDVVAGSPRCCVSASQRLQMWRGVSGGGVELTPSQSISFIGAATVVLAADFSLDGRPDLIVATDGNNYGSASNIGGKAFFYENNGTATPFSDGFKTQFTNWGAPNKDYDVGFVFNYDRDPANTPDIMIADGNNASNFLLFANRTLDVFVPCGDAISGVLDLGPLASTEMVITSARLSPTVQLNGGTVKWFMSNEEPPNWVEAVDCGDGSGDVCANFPRPVGREVRWKAEMCSPADRLQSPTISNIQLKFDYTESSQFLRSGVVISDGVTYMGTFSQPGDRGKFYALNTGLDTVYWEFGEKLDAMSDASRNIYTTTTDGQSGLDFRWTGNTTHDTQLMTTLGASDATQAQNLINWVRSARFGLDGGSVPLTRLGGVELSTPAVVNKPGMPIWYTLAGSDDRAMVDTFVSAYSNRLPFVLFGAKDGMIHAVRNVATDISNPDNGNELWAFIPGKVASRMITDYTNSQSGTLDIAAYPDGAPTVADVKIGGQLRTLAVIGSGNGGKNIAAIDITQTVDPMSGSVTGPTPLWHATPGDADAGQSFAKPVIARVNIGDSERFIAIAGTGIGFDNVVPPYTKGRTIIAYDVASGTPLWKFQTACPLTSHIAVFETDDDAEPGTPKLDGFMDRVVFADRCGYLYKVDPAKDLGGDWNDNENFGAIQVGEENGKKFFALFSTTLPDALGPGQERPIAGTLGVRADSTTRVAIYFGTGGLEEYDPTKVNEFYAIYADTGELRSKITGACNGATGLCEKFYGGVVVTTEQVIYTRSTDRRIAAGVCDNGSSAVQAVRLTTDGNGDFIIDFTVPISSAAVGSLYGDAGAVYLATLSGEVVRVGAPRTSVAGGDTAAGNTGGFGGGEQGSTGSNAPLVLMGWRQIF